MDASATTMAAVLPPGRCAGVDEAGRGALAGPVAAAAVILDPDRPITGLADSKLLSPARRTSLAAAIRTRALAWCVAQASVAEIERLNVLGATLLAMERALAGLYPRPDFAVIDGLHCPAAAVPMRAVVKADRKVAAVSAASILAKTERDLWLCEMDLLYPGYGFSRHKGYGVPEHREALAALGPIPEHRRGFAPVRRALAASP